MHFKGTGFYSPDYKVIELVILKKKLVSIFLIKKKKKEEEEEWEERREKNPTNQNPPVWAGADTKN